MTSQFREFMKDRSDNINLIKSTENLEKIKVQLANSIEGDIFMLVYELDRLNEILERSNKRK